MSLRFDMYLYGPRIEGENNNVGVTGNNDGDKYHVVRFVDVGDPPTEHFDTKVVNDEE